MSVIGTNTFRAIGRCVAHGGWVAIGRRVAVNRGALERTLTLVKDTLARQPSAAVAASVPGCGSA